MHDCNYYPLPKSHWHPVRLTFHALPGRVFKLGIHETRGRRSVCLLRVFYYHRILPSMGDPNFIQETLGCYN